MTKQSNQFSTSLAKRNTLSFLSLVALVFSLYGQSIEITSPVPEPYDLSSVVYAGLSEEFRGVSGTAPGDLNFNTDGTKLFVLARQDDAIKEYLLSAPYDISSAVFQSEFSVESEENDPRDFAFSGDGKKMFVIGYGADAVVEYNLTTGFDLTTATYAGEAEEFILFTGSFPFPWYEAIEFSVDGLKMFVANNVNNVISAYTLTAPFDVSTASFSEELNVSAQLTWPTGLYFSADGTKMIVSDTDGDALFEYNLSSAYSISSATYKRQFSIKPQNTSPNGVKFDQDGLKMYIAGSNSVIEYLISSSANYNENSTDVVINVDSNDGQGGANDQNITYLLDGPDASLFDVSAEGFITFISPPDFESPLDENGDNDYVITVIASTATDEASIPIIITIRNVNDSPVINYTGSTEFDLSKARHTGVTQELVLEEPIPSDIEFNKDGSKLFVLGNGQVTEYQLLIPYEVSSATNTATSFISEETSSRGMTFNADGTKMYITGPQRDGVFEYNLEIAFDLSTIQFSGSLFFVASQERSPMALTFNEDGTRMFVIGSQRTVFEYELSTSYNVSTATYTNEFQPAGLASESIMDMQFISEGSKLFFLSASERVMEYSLSVNYDVSTLSYENDFLTTSEESNPRGFAFKPDGSKMFVAGPTDDAVVEYNLAAGFVISENSSEPITNIDANDGQGGANDASVTYSLGGPDGSQFSIDADGVISFNTSPNYESPSDENTDGVYELEVVATHDGNSASQPISVSIEDVSDSPIFTYTGEPSFDVTTAEYTGAWEDLELSLGSPNSILFNPDGTKLFVLDGAIDMIVQYDLETAYDISTALNQPVELSTGSEESSPLGFTFSTDGTRLFVVGSNGRAVVEYDLTSAFDLQTATYSGPNEEFSIETELSTPRSIAFNNSGTRMFIGDPNRREILQYDLGVAFDVSTAVYSGESQNFYTGQIISAQQGFKFNNNGRELFVVDRNAREVIQYSLSTGFDLSTAVFHGEFRVRDQFQTPVDLLVDLEGTRLFVFGASKKTISEYRLGSSIDYLENSTDILLNIDANDGQGGANDDVTYSLSGEDASDFSIDGSGIITFNAAPDFEDPQDANRDNQYEIRVIASNTIDQVGQSIVITVQNVDDTPVFTHVGSGSYDVSSGIYAGLASEFGLVNTPSGLTFSSDGTKMFTVSTLSRRIDEYVLSVPYDFTTAVHSGSAESFSVASEEVSPNAITFDPSGTKMFIVGSSQDKVITYDLGTSFDISTAVHAGEEAEFSVTNEDGTPTGLIFNADGTRMFMSGSNNRRIFTYTLTSPFDVSTATYSPESGSFDVGSQHVRPQGIRFNPDGTRMFIVGNFWDRISQYELGSPFDLTTAVFDKNLNLSNAGDALGLAFNSDGSRLFLAESSKKAILEYRLASEIDYDEGNVVPALDIDANDGQGGANDDITYTLEGDNASVLSINGSGIISFNTAPDFENPEDNDGNNVYEVNVVIDNGIHEAVQPVRINIIDLDFSITSPAEVEVAENTTEVVYTIIANEATGVRLGTAGDEGLFSLNGNEISFLSAPDYEVPEDNDTDNEYLIEVIADDGLGGSISLEVTIRVTDVDEIPPVITSPVSAEVQENSVFNIYTATANETVTFTLGSLKDEALFSIEEGELSFIDAPDFENPQDGNTDNAYQLDLIATDEAGNVSSIELTIIITDQGDEIAPVITSASEAPVVENTTSSFYTIQADEPVTFSLGTTKDEEFFTLDTDEIRFTEAPDFENPQDEDEDNIYQVDLIATDLAGNQSTKLLEINVTDVDDTPPVISSPVSISVLENITGVIYTATADESATFTLGSTKDESLFMIDGDEISFIASPDYEDPQDVNTDNTYLIDLVATDGADNSSTTEISITVTDVDEIAPTITSPMAVSVEENSSGVFYEATADEQATFTLGGTSEEVAFILSGTKDDNLFSIVDDEISFITSPDFENPQDADGNNIYLIDLIATDAAGNSSTVEVSITVTDVDDTPPVITSPSAISVAENTSGTVYVAEADEAVTYSLGTVSGPREISILDVNSDDGLFIIENENEIRFVSPPDYENPQDFNNDNIYLINLIATDDARNSTTLEVLITVTDADEIAPAITSASSISIEENSTGSVYTATADEAVLFSLGLATVPDLVVTLAIGQKDEGLFNLEGDQISFINPPDFEDPQDLDADNIYQLDLVATDEAGNFSTIEVTITVTDVDEIAPTITSPTEVSIEENSTGEFYVAGADEPVTFSLGNNKDESLFELTSNEISFISSPDFEDPQDVDENNAYLVDLIATDEAGNSSTVEITVTVTDVDEIAPVITSPSAISVVENTFETIYTAEADETVTFALGRAPLIVSAPTQGIEKDEDLFSLDGNEISFINAPDFENPQDLDGDNVYQFDLVATDEAGNETTLEVAITVMDLDEIAPTITSASSLSVEENSSGSVYTATADEAVVFSLGLDRDPDEVATLASGRKDEGLFNLEGDQISFIAPPDFEDPQDLDGDNIYRIDLVATDEAGNFSTIEVAITVTDIDEIDPIITSASSLNVEENFDGIVYTATANETVTFSLGQTKDESLFLLNDNSITFLTSPDFENPRDGNQDNVYVIDLTATDLAGNESTLEVGITVTDLEDGTPPSITSSSSVVIDENQTGTIYTASANEAVTFSLGGLKDEALFILDGDGIRFINAPDFENPQDVDGDNTYLIDLTAVNESGNSTTLEVSISVQDVDEENPLITSPSMISIEENVTGRIYTATASETVTFSLGSDKDEALFLISENLIAFVNAPDFENPLDEDEDNVYLIDLVATDEAGNVGTLEVAITVTDVDDQVLSTVDEIALSFYPNPASEWVTVEGPEIIDRVSFFDLNGKRLLEQKVRKIKTQIDVSGLPAGMYLMIVEMNGKKTEERFIKK